MIEIQGSKLVKNDEDFTAHLTLTADAFREATSAINRRFNREHTALEIIAAFESGITRQGYQLTKLTLVTDDGDDFVIDYTDKLKEVDKA